MQIRYIVLAVLFFSIGQSMAWMQMNAPILWSSFNRYKWILILLGIPVTWIFMTATQYAVSGFEGNLGAVYFYSSTLSQSEIEDNFNATKSRYGL